MSPPPWCRPEREYVRRAGYNPMTSNVIRSIVKGVVGYFRTLQDERGGYASVPYAVKETDVRTFESFLDGRDKILTSICRQAGNFK